MSAPAGWYPNPNNDGRLRYWSGSSWTEHYANPPTAQASNKRGPKIAAWVVGVVVVLGIIGAVTGNDGQAEPYPGTDSGDNSGYSDTGTGSSDCESQVADMQAQGITAENDHAYYVDLCEQMK